MRAAALWAGERGVVSGQAAAFWHGMLPAQPGEILVTVPRSGGLRPHPGVRVRRRDLPYVDVVGLDGVRLTAPSLTALETAAALPDGSSFLDRALQRHVRFPTLYRTYCRHLGAQGFGRVTELLTAAADRADSAAERLLTGLLRRHGITGWQCGATVGRWILDVSFAKAKVAVEVDG